MKKYTLFFILFLIFSRAGLGADSSHVNYFSDYINSPKAPVVNAADNSVSPNNATNNEVSKNSDETGPTAALQGIPAQWKACTIDSDCTAGVVDCMSWQPLNKKYLHKLVKDLDPCLSSVDPGFQPQAVCINKACQTTDKSTDVTWEEWLSEMRKVPKNTP